MKFEADGWLISFIVDRNKRWSLSWSNLTLRSHVHTYICTFLPSWLFSSHFSFFNVAPSYLFLFKRSLLFHPGLFFVLWFSLWRAWSLMHFVIAILHAVRGCYPSCVLMWFEGSTVGFDFCSICFPIWAIHWFGFWIFFFLCDQIGVSFMLFLWSDLEVLFVFDFSMLGVVLLLWFRF